MSNALERWINNKKVNPFREFSRLEDRMDRLFSEMFRSSRQNGIQEYEFSPACDISEDKEKYILKVDLPGIQKENVKVEVNKDLLTISAERKEEKISDDQKVHLSEVYYGSYTRSFTLPGLVDEKKVDAKFVDGILTISVPKTPALLSKQVPVQ